MLEFLPSPLAEGTGIFELQAASGEALYGFNATGKPANSNEFLKPNLTVESAGGSDVQWATGDGKAAGGVLMFQERRGWTEFAFEDADLQRAIYAVANGAWLANKQTGQRCALILGYGGVVPIRGDRLYGPFQELNIWITPRNKTEAKWVLQGGKS